MPGPEFFHQFGLFIVRDFLDFDACCSLRREMEAAPNTLATVWRDGQAVVDESVRSVKSAAVPACTEASVRERFMAVRSALERHFEAELQGCQQLQFLVYREGAFYHPHKDTSSLPNAHPDLLTRKVATVLFLSGEGERPGPDSFAGGALAFYGLLEAPPWHELGLPLAAERGLLVGFPADLIHEVQPVKAGERYTVVTWFG